MKGSFATTKVFVLTVKKADQANVKDIVKENVVTFSKLEEEQKSDIKKVSTTFIDAQNQSHTSQLHIAVGNPTYTITDEAGIKTVVDVDSSKSSSINAITVFQNANGSQDSLIDLKDSEGNTKTFAISAVPTDVTAEISDMGALQMVHSSSSSTVKGSVNDQGDVLHVVDANNLQTKATSKLGGASITINEQGGVSTVSQSEIDQKFVKADVVTDETGKTTQTLTVGDASFEARSELAGSETTVSANGEVMTSLTRQNVGYQWSPYERQSNS